jgi:hypothetical protein
MREGPDCDECGAEETVKHHVMECPGYRKTQIWKMKRRVYRDPSHDSGHGEGSRSTHRLYPGHKPVDWFCKGHTGDLEDSKRGR